MGVVTSLFLIKMVTAAGESVDRAALLRSVGIDPDAPVDPRMMVADTAYYDLLERIAQSVDVTALPLRAGASMRTDDYGALGLAFKTAPTLYGSFARVARYARLWTSVVGYSLEVEKRGVWFFLHRAGARRLGLRLSNEATLASAVGIAREVSTGAVAPLEVHLQHPSPRLTAEHERYFSGSLVFESDRDALLFPREMLDQPNTLGDAGLTAYLEGQLEAAIGDLPPGSMLKEEVRRAVARALTEGVPGMEEIARRLGMSARSLRRRLREEGLGFQSIAEEARREMAEGLMKDARYSLSEVAFLTGFADQSAFSRAFRRWTGQTPARYRTGHEG